MIDQKPLWIHYDAINMRKSVRNTWTCDEPAFLVLEVVDKCFRVPVQEGEDLSDRMGHLLSNGW